MTKSAPIYPRIRSLKPDEWSEVDQRNWAEACRAAGRLSRGGRASHLKPVSRADLACRYGLFLDFLARAGLLPPGSGSSSLITRENVSAYLAEITARVSSVSVYGAISKLRRMGEILDPVWDGSWLTEIEQDLAWGMRPAPKQHRIVDSDRLWQLGLDLMQEAEERKTLPTIRRALLYRNGLMVSLLASCPIRLRNFAALEIGSTLRNVGDDWVITLPASQTKGGRPDERPVSREMTRRIDSYLGNYRRSVRETNALWVGRTGEALGYSGVERVIVETTRREFGTSISPHLFRSCAASTVYRNLPAQSGMAAAILQHTDLRITERYYNRARNIGFAARFAELLESSRLSIK